MNNQVKSLRLSDAIGLGRTLITPNEGWTTLYEGRGCAIGMALAAMGEKYGSCSTLKKHWPWADFHIFSIISSRYLSVVRGDSTLDQLIDFVRSIEPPEEEAPVAAEEPRVLAAK